MRTIDDLGNIEGKRILLRLDLNVPLEGREVRDTYRIDRALPTLAELRRRGARVVVLSHIGKGKPEDTLAPVAQYLSQKFPITFLPSLRSEENRAVVDRMQNGDVVLFENVRHDPGEEANSDEFSSWLAMFGDAYVNDAFAVSHRPHASVVGLARRLPHAAGLLFAEEVRRLSMVLTPPHPFLFILGGAKIETKMPLLKKFIGRADKVFVGGAIANNFFKVAGHEIGRSLFDKDQLDGLSDFLANERLILPADVVVKNDAGSEPRRLDQVTSGDMIVDVGMDTVHELEGVIGAAELIVWNGPLGYYEEGFTEGTRELLNLIAGSRATSIIGGGDTVALINEMGTLERFSFVSTGGGAMLDFLANDTLPGIEALR